MLCEIRTLKVSKPYLELRYKLCYKLSEILNGTLRVILQVMSFGVHLEMWAIHVITYMLQVMLLCMIHDQRNPNSNPNPHPNRNVCLCTIHD